MSFTTCAFHRSIIPLCWVQRLLPVEVLIDSHVTISYMLNYGLQKFAQIDERCAINVMNEIQRNSIIRVLEKRFIIIYQAQEALIVAHKKRSALFNI